jgi:hypothetical protein
MSPTNTSPELTGAFAPFCKRFSQTGKPCLESVVCGLKLLGWIARKFSRCMIRRAVERPIFTSAAIRRVPYRRRCSLKQSLTRAAESLFNGLSR